MGLSTAVTLLLDLYGSGQGAVGGVGPQEFRLEGCQEWRPSICCTVYICVSLFVLMCPWDWITWQETSKDSKIGSDYSCQGAVGAVREQGQSNFTGIWGRKILPGCQQETFSLPLAFLRGGLLHMASLLTPYFSSWGEGHTSDGECGRLACLPPGNVCPDLFSATPTYPVLQGTSSFQHPLCQVGKFNLRLKCCWLALWSYLKPHAPFISIKVNPFLYICLSPMFILVGLN